MGQNAAADRQHKQGRRRRARWREKLMRAASVRAALFLIWLVRMTCRIRVVQGAQHIDAIVARGTPVVPCSWHRHIFISGLFLCTLVARGLRVGFLISPSREGEFIARIARAHRGEVVRGSSSRTGREAMRALTQAVAEGMSPTLYGDGPRGPAQVFKPGAVILASRTGAPLILMGCAASRYWQLGSWDAGRIPKPFARLAVTIGEPWQIGKLGGSQQAESLAAEVGHRLQALERAAEAALE